MVTRLRSPNPGRGLAPRVCSGPPPLLCQLPRLCHRASCQGEGGTTAVGGAGVGASRGSKFLQST